MAARCLITRSAPDARGTMFLRPSVLAPVPRGPVQRGPVLRAPALALLLLAALDIAALFLAAPAVHAQHATPQTFHACYVPASGTVYRIREPGLRTNCHASSHVEFSWMAGPDGGVLKPGDAASGDLAGTFPSPSVSGLRGRPLSADAPAAGQVLVWNGTTWTPASPPSGITTHGDLSGLTSDDHPQYLLVSPTTRALIGDLHAGGNRITNLAAATASGQAVVFQQAVKVGDAAGGDVGGTFPSLSVQRLQGHQLSSVAPQNGEVLSYNASASRWEPRQPYQPNTHVEAAGEVLANGTTASGALELTSTRTATGRYRISFPQYRSTNRYTVDLTVMGAAPGFANVVQFATGGIDIFTFDHTGAAADRPFMVSVQRYPL